MHESRLKIHRVIGQLPTSSCCTLVPFPADFSACLRLWGFAFFLGVIISTNQYSKRQPAGLYLWILLIFQAALEADQPCVDGPVLVSQCGSIGSPRWNPWKAIRERLLHLYLSRSARLGSLLFVSLLDIHLSPQLAVNVLSDIPPKLCKLLLS